MELKSNEEKITRALLVSVDTGEYDAQASLDELFELVKSAGADPVLSVTQNLQKIEKGTFVGTGKLAEIAEICESQVYGYISKPEHYRSLLLRYCKIEVS